MESKGYKRGPRAVSPERTPTHFRRLLMQRGGASIEAIAKSDKVDVETVRESIQAAEVYQAAYSLDFTNASVHKTIIGSMPAVTKTIKRGLAAKKIVEKNGRKKEVDDIELQLKTADRVATLIEHVQPKGGKGITVNTSATSNAQANQSFSELNYTPGFEDKLDEIRQRVEDHNRTQPLITGTVIDHDAEVEEEESAEESEAPCEEPDDESAEPSP